MSAVSDFVQKQKAFNDRQSAAIDTVATATAGLAGDIEALNKKIEELQNSPGDITPEDQALLDELTTLGEGLAAKAEAAAAAAKALDDANPPTPPPNP